jgi:hypothetical protein
VLQVLSADQTGKFADDSSKKQSSPESTIEKSNDFSGKRVQQSQLNHFAQQLDVHTIPLS